MNKTFLIKGKYYKENCFPGLNDLLREAQRSSFSYNRMKRAYEDIVILNARKSLKGWKARSKVQLNITWGEKKKGQKRDFDNIVAAGRKIINDALVKAKFLEDDKPQFLGYGENNFVYSDVPFIEIEIEEIEGIEETESEDHGRNVGKRRD